MTRLPLGKQPARPGAYSFRLADYLTAPLPAAPAVFGHQALVTGYPMLGNDRYGDCVWAGAAHETQTWTAEAGTVATFLTQDVLADYAACTGFNPSDPASDRGTDMQTAASYRRKVGIVDAAGTRHKVDAYLELPGVSACGVNSATMLPALASAAYAFGGVGVGIEFPDTAEAQFEQDKPWDVVAGAKIEGGHYVPLLGRVANGNYVVVTWGRIQEVTPAFLQRYVDEAVVYLSLERLNVAGKTLDGFDVAALRADLAQLGGTTPTPAPAPTPSPTDLDTAMWANVRPWVNARHRGEAERTAVWLEAWAAAKGYQTGTSA